MDFPNHAFGLVISARVNSEGDSNHENSSLCSTKLSRKLV